jgi:hypothetical protein
MNKIEENRLILNEELSISDHVLKVTDKIYNAIIAKPGNRKYELNNFDFIAHLDLTCNFKMYQNGGVIGWCNSDTATLDSNKQLICKMVITGNFREDIGGNINSEMDYVKAAIQHEVEHLYQSYCKLLNQKQHSSDMYYKVSILGMKEKNPVIQFVSYIYYATDSEQDAFVNTMYSILIKMNTRDSEELYERSRKTQAGSLLKILNDAYRLLSDRRTPLIYDYKDMIQWLSKYDIEFDLKKTLKLCNFRIKRLESKIGKVLTKVKEDKKMWFSEVCLNLDKTILERFEQLVNYY